MRNQTYLKTLIICIVAITFLFACSSDKAEPTTNDNEKNEEEQTVSEPTTTETEENLEEEPSQSEANLLEIAPEEPTTLEEIVAYPTGPLAGLDYEVDMDYMVEVVKENLPPIDESKEEDEAYLDKWWRAFRYLFAEDYPDPNNIIRQMTLEQFGNPDIEDKRFHFKDQMNVLVILDVSGSMANEINGKSMMDIAKDSINEFVSDLPEDVNIGLRVYGHEGKRTGKTKEESCKSTELVYDIQPLDKQEFMSVIEPFEPTGWTPIGLSLEKVKEDFADYPSDKNTNLVYVVSDGAETCGGDPVKAAEDLVDSNIEPIINVIGFNVDIEGQSHLREIADAGGGVYINAGNEEQLQEAFEHAKEVLKQWDEWKRGAKEGAYHSKRDQLINLSNIFSEWHTKNRREKINRQFVLAEITGEEGLITSKAVSYMYERNSDLFRTFYEINDTDIHDNYYKDINENYEELMKEINKKYKKNTEN